MRWQPWPCRSTRTPGNTNAACQKTAGTGARVTHSGVRTDLDLCHETAVGRDAVPPILDQVQGVLPGQVVKLHDVHHDKRGGQADAT